MSRIPARCNKRQCQARRNLSQLPVLYKYWPKCHKGGCDGLMYVDNYRLKKLEVKQRPTCYDDCRWYPHRIDSKFCKHREEWILSKAMEPISKHRPFVQEDEPPF